MMASHPHHDDDRDRRSNRASQQVFD